MKKIFAILLCVALFASMLSLVSCDKDKDGKKYSETLNGKTPAELYEFSREQLALAESYSVKTEQVIKMSYQGEKMTMHQSAETKVNGDDTYMVTENDFDDSLNMESWYVDGVCYSNMFGQKVKSTISKSEYMEKYMEADPSESTLLDIPESWFEDVKFETSGKSNVLEFEVSGEKFSNFLDNIGLGGATIDGNIDFKIYFDDDGNLTKVVMEFDMLMAGAEASCVSTSYVTIEDVKITPPSDASTYKEVDL